jgi:hypothetical protein
MKKIIKIAFDARNRLRTGNEVKRKLKEKKIGNFFQIKDAVSVMLAGFHMPCGVFMITLPVCKVKTRK